MKNVAVIGMGPMGPGIAATLARGGMNVRGYATRAAAAANSGALINSAFVALEGLSMPDHGSAAQISLRDSLEDCLAGAELVVRLRQLDVSQGAVTSPHAGRDSVFVGKVQAGEIYNQSPTQCTVHGSRRWVTPGGVEAARSGVSVCVNC